MGTDINVIHLSCRSVNMYGMTGLASVALVRSKSEYLHIVDPNVMDHAHSPDVKPLGVTATWDQIIPDTCKIPASLADMQRIIQQFVGEDPKFVMYRQQRDHQELYEQFLDFAGGVDAVRTWPMKVMNVYEHLYANNIKPEGIARIPEGLHQRTDALTDARYTQAMFRYGLLRLLTRRVHLTTSSRKFIETFSDWGNHDPKKQISSQRDAVGA